MCLGSTRRYEERCGVSLKVANFNFPKVDFASQVGEKYQAALLGSQ